MPLVGSNRFKCLNVSVKYGVSLDVEKDTWRMDIGHNVNFYPRHRLK